MSLFRAFHAIGFKSGKDEGTLIVLRDQPLEHRGWVWFLPGEIPAVICYGGKQALDYVKEHAKPVAILSVVDGESGILPALVAKEIETTVEEKTKDKDGKEVTTPKTVKTTVMVEGTFSNDRVESACNKLFRKMDLIEQIRFCNVEQILALEVSKTIREKVKLEHANKPEQIAEIKKAAVLVAEKNVKKQLSSSQMALLQKRLGVNGTVQKVINPE